jgi:CubicO group peptidase (beta-lactamase class C family)
MPVTYRNPGRVEFTAEIRVQAVPVLDLLSVVVYAPSRWLDDESKEEKMNRSRLYLLAVAAVIIWTGLQPVLASVPDGQITPAAPDIQALDSFVAGELKAKGLVGLSVALMIDGKVVLAKGYGRSALDSGAAVTPETPFAIGSITKQFTCACILKLAEAGKLSVDDKVAKYYPGLTRAGDITLLDLMNHVSGYADYYPLDFVDRRMLKEIAPDELIHEYAGGKLDFEPGSRYSYSNTGFVILGRVVEKISGQPFGKFLAEQVLMPLGLNHTLYEPDPDKAGIARGYTTFALSEPEAATNEARGWIGSAGAIYSTASDLAAWDLALITGEALNPSSFTLMTTPRPLADGRTSFYGCGLSISFRSERRVLAHNGAVAGFYALNSCVPSTKSAVVVLSNFDSYDAVNAIYSRLMAAVLTTTAPYIPAISGPPAAEAHKLMLKSFEEEKVDRSLLGDEFSWYLTDEKLRAASLRLKPYGEPRKVDVLSASERGGMEVSRVRFTFANGTLVGQMYRSPDGKVQQFFMSKE